MIDSVRRFFADYRRQVAILQAKRRRRDDAIVHLAAHPELYVGKSIEIIFDKCGQPDHSCSFDFGQWVAQWERRDGSRVSVFVKNDQCTRVE